jgi:hypothetical protein
MSESLNGSCEIYIPSVINNEKRAELVVYNVSGKEIRRFENVLFGSKIVFYGDDLTSGIYIVRLISDGFSTYGKVVLLR